MIELEDLEDYFDDLSFDGPTKQQLAVLYQIFLKDFADKNNPLIINGKVVKYNRNTSKHPICKDKAQAFEHIITRESKIANKRNFDRERTNKIHWIRPILENTNDTKIKCFERINDKGFNQHFYWYEDKGFIIILREIQPDIMLITSFSVDKAEKLKFKRWYEEYRDGK